MPKVYAVIMAGGAGTRFWRLARAAAEAALAARGRQRGDAPRVDGVRRLAPLVTEDRVVVVTGEHLAEATRRPCRACRDPQILCEPAPRNTAPCIAWATATVARLDSRCARGRPAERSLHRERGGVPARARSRAADRRGRPRDHGRHRPDAPRDGLRLHRGRRRDRRPERARRAWCASSRSPTARAPRRSSRAASTCGRRCFFFRASDMSTLVERHLPELAAGIAKIRRRGARGEREPLC